LIFGQEIIKYNICRIDYLPRSGLLEQAFSADRKKPRPLKISFAPIATSDAINSIFRA